MIMVEHTITGEQTWVTMQEPRCRSYAPTAYLLLLSAIDNGWKVGKIELEPSWDQHGFIYLVTLSHPSQKINQQLILPKNAIVDSFLFKQSAGSLPTAVQSYQMAHV
jgi:hypothetical protein